mgnify:CR=1 FL=1
MKPLDARRSTRRSSPAKSKAPGKRALQTASSSEPMSRSRSASPPGRGDDRDRDRPRRSSGRHAGAYREPAIFLGGLPFDTDERTLRDLCERYGDVESVKISYDMETRKSRGFAFITFARLDDALDAAERINGTDVEGRIVRCNMAEDKPERANGGGSAGKHHHQVRSSITLVPIRPRRRGERRSLRTLPGASLRPGSPAFNTRPRCLSTSTDAFQLHPDVRSYRTALIIARDRRPAAGVQRDVIERPEATTGAVVAATTTTTTTTAGAGVDRDAAGAARATATATTTVAVAVAPRSARDATRVAATAATTPRRRRRSRATSATRGRAARTSSGGCERSRRPPRRRPGEGEAAEGGTRRGRRAPTLWSARSRCVLVAPVPVRRRSRGERRSLRTFSPGASLRPGSLAFNPRPRCLSTPTDAFELHPDIIARTERPRGDDARAGRAEARGAAREQGGGGGVEVPRGVGGGGGRAGEDAARGEGDVRRGRRRRRRRRRRWGRGGVTDDS